LLGRRDDVIMTGITTTVVMVVAAITPTHAWEMPTGVLLSGSRPRTGGSDRQGEYEI
jgi:hypothetical protein